MITIYDQNGKEVAMFQGHSNLKYEMISNSSRLEILKTENVTNKTIVASYPPSYYGEINSENKKIKLKLLRVGLERFQLSLIS